MPLVAISKTSFDILSYHGLSKTITYNSANCKWRNFAPPEVINQNLNLSWEISRRRVLIFAIFKHFVFFAHLLVNVSYSDWHTKRRKQNQFFDEVWVLKSIMTTHIRTK